MATPHRHPQVPVLWFECDEEIAELITLMNYCGVRTTLSCQDNRFGGGLVRRVWAEILGEDLLRFLTMLDRPGEAGDVESLSLRMAGETYPEDRQDYEENRAWHYRATVDRKDGELLPLRIGVRFPYTDLPEVTARLRSAAREIAGFPPDDRQPPGP